MIKTRVSTQIARSPADVFAYLTDVTHFPLLYAGIVRESRPLGTGPLAEGSAFQISGSFLGRPFEARLVVTAYAPDRQFCVASNWGPLPFQGCYELEPAGGGTLLTDRHSINAGGFFALAGSLLVNRLKQQAERNLARLKELVEAPAAPEG